MLDISLTPGFCVVVHCDRNTLLRSLSHAKPYPSLNPSQEIASPNYTVSPLPNLSSQPIPPSSLLTKLLTLGGGPLLLRIPLAPTPRNLLVLEPVLLLVVEDLALRVQRAELWNRADAWRVVGCDGGAAQARREE